MFLKSIRWRWQLWLGFLLVCMLCGFGVTVYHLQRLTWLHAIDLELNRRVTALSGPIRGPMPGFGPPPAFQDGPEDGPGFDPDGPPPPRPPFRRRGGPPPGVLLGIRPDGRPIRIPPFVAELFDDTRTNGYYHSIWSWNGDLLVHSTNGPAAIPWPVQIGRDMEIHDRTRGDFREGWRFTEIGDCVLVGSWIGADLATIDRFKWLLIAAGGVVLAVGLGVSGWLATRAIRPVREISAAAGRISAGNLAERITVADKDNELGELANVLNSTFARLEAAFAREKQFAADASHELRTPLAVLIAEAQTILARPRNAEEYREAIAVCLDTAQQMRRLTESLLELARLDAGQEPVRFGPLDLAGTARSCVERIQPLAAERGVRILCELNRAGVSGDAERLVQVVTNLLNNAIHYNRPNGEVRLHTAIENGSAILTVADTGPGIAAEDLPHIFERFYRVDKARSRAEGRSGLGLAICKSIIDAHRGTIEVSSRLGHGTTFTVKLPATGAPQPNELQNKS